MPIGAAAAGLWSWNRGGGPTFYGWGNAANGGGRFAPDHDAAQLVVTNLNDSGAGSLRAALEASGKRYITFDPSLEGYITLDTDTIEVAEGRLTLDGSDASICVRGPVNSNDTAIRLLPACSDFVIRQMRVGVGESATQSSSRKSLHLNNCSNGYIANSEFFWGTDGTCEGGFINVTLDNCLIAHTLSLADHYESGFVRHSLATLVNTSSHHYTFYRTIWLHSEGRNPQVANPGPLEMINCITAGWTTRGFEESDWPEPFLYDMIGSIWVQTTEASPYQPTLDRYPIILSDTAVNLYVDDLWAVNKTGAPALRWPIGSGGDAWDVVGDPPGAEAGPADALIARSPTRLATSPVQPPILPASGLWASLKPTVGKTLPWRIAYTATLLEDVEVMLERTGAEPTYGIIDGIEASLGGGTELLGAWPSMAEPS